MSKCEKCKGTGTLPNARRMPQAHVLMTVIGGIVVWGDLEGRENAQKKHDIEALASNDELWLTIYNAGVNHVQLYL